MSIPELRFPEFKEPWTPAHAGDAFEHSKTKGEAGLPIWSVTLDRGLVPRDSLERHMGADAADESNLRAQPGDLVYNMMRMWQGAVGMASKECMVSPAYVVLSPKEGIEPRFFDHWFKNKRMLYLLWAYSHGLTEDRLRLYFNDFSRIPLALPGKGEQKKIADILDVSSQKITLLAEKKTALEEYKRGVMQRLFSRALRFTRDDRSAFPEWKERKLKDVFEEIRGKVGEQEIETYSISAGKGFVSQAEKFGKDISGQQNERYTVLDEGEFAYNKGNSKSYRYGCIYPNNTGKMIAVPNVFISFRSRDPENVVGFFAKLFENHHLDRGLRRIISSGARMDGLLNINKDYFFDLTVPVPHPDEQRKIADFLSTIDAKIDAVSDQISAMETFKKGLLQKMFV